MPPLYFFFDRDVEGAADEAALAAAAFVSGAADSTAGLRTNLTLRVAGSTSTIT